MEEVTPLTIPRLSGRFDAEFYSTLDSSSQGMMKAYVLDTLAPQLAGKLTPTPFYTNKDYFSNFNKDYPWTDDHGVQFLFGEQWLMLGKAVQFGDHESAKKIMRTTDPKTIKSIGRSVTPYDDAQWSAQRYNWMVYGLIQKAKHNASFGEKIMSKAGLFPVEAAPGDTIWGVGAGKDKAAQIDNWRGTNLLGFAIMEARWHLENGTTDQA
eukprot:Filipodium_phascolosomae@DN5753_c0_g1_i1.p1